MKNRKIISLLMACCLLILTGCTGQVEISERAIIQGVGVDADGSGFLVTVHASNPDAESKIDVHQAKGETVLDALNNLSKESGKTPLYSHNMLIILGEKSVKNGLDQVMDFFVRHYEARPAVNVFMTKGRAEDIFKVKKDEKYLKTEDIMRLATNERINGKTVSERVIDVVNQMEGEGTSPVLPVLELNKEQAKVRVTDTAFFKDNHLKGFLKSPHSRAILLLGNGVQEGQAVVNHPKVGKVTLTLQGAKAKIKSSIHDGVPHFDIKIDCEAEIGEIQKELVAGHYGTDLDREFAKMLGNQLCSQTRGAIKEAITQNRADVFGFSRELLQHQTAWWKKNREHWDSIMPKCTFSVSADVQVNRVEQEISPLF